MCAFCDLRWAWGPASCAVCPEAFAQECAFSRLTTWVGLLIVWIWVFSWKCIIFCYIVLGFFPPINNVAFLWNFSWMLKLLRRLYLMVCSPLDCSCSSTFCLCDSSWWFNDSSFGRIQENRWGSTSGKCCRFLYSFLFVLLSLAAPKINGRVIENKFNEIKSILKFVLGTPKNMHIVGLWMVLIFLSCG